VTNSSSLLTGTYSSTTGLSINGTTGEIDPGTSTPGTYTVTYVIAADAGCSSVSAVTNVTVTAAPTATLSYGTPFCTSNTVAQLPTVSGTTGGSYSSTTGLTLNASTGAVTASTSTAGSYTVTYTVAASNGCSSITATAPVVITSAPTASIVYGGTPFCTNSGAQSVTNSSSVLTGTYSSTTGLSINGTTGEIDPGTSTPGTYTVTYVIAADAGCSSVSAVTNVTVTAAPTATLSYGTPFCTSNTVAQLPTVSGTTGGSYSSTTGLTLNASTGAVTASTSTAGSYTVTYTVAASNGCSSITATAPVVITSAPTASIVYGGTPFCTNSGAQSVTNSSSVLTGTYSSTTGLSINGTTGEIDPGTSTPGTYTVTYVIAADAGCSSVSAVTNVTVTAQPIANAGQGGNSCSGQFIFNAVVSTGAGVWSQSSGPGSTSFSNANSPTATATVTQQGVYTYTWTETNGTCVDVDQVTVNFYDSPVANAGVGGDECDLDFVLSASLTTGSGNWTVAGPGTATYLPSSSAPGATVSVSQVGSYIFTWTETNGVCVTSDNVTVNFYNQTIADAGTGGNECDLDFVLNAQPSYGIGTWNQTSGPGFSNFIPNANTPNATVSVSQYGTYQFTWTELNGICTSSDVISVNFFEQPVANAGQNANECDLNHVLGAVASVGDGTWTQVSGPGTSVFTDLTLANTTVTVDAYGTYVYQWEEVEGTCSDAATVTINYYLQPVADAGFGGFECDYDFPLVANASVGLGTWTYSGPGTATFAPNTSDPSAVVTVSALGEYTFTWTEVNGSCSDSDDVVVTFEQQTFADAGQGGDECDLTFTFTGSFSFGTGIWTYTGPGIAFFTDDNSPASVVTVDTYGTYDFTWTETNGTCITSDQVTVNFYEQPVAQAGQGGDACDLDFAFNGSASVGIGTWIQTSGPGTSVFDDVNSAVAVVTVDSYGTYTYTWTEVNGTCSDSQTITVNFYNQPVADAGQGGNECDLDFDLAAIPSLGTGIWTQVVGPGTSTYISANSASTTVTADQYGTYTYAWTETNGSCVSTDEIIVDYHAQPLANAGNGGDACDLDFILSATLSTGTGVWSQTAGSGVATFNNPTSPTAIVSVDQNDTYTFTWTETSGTCSDSESVSVNFWNQPTADAGQGGSECDLNFVLNALPSLGSGEWTQNSGPGTSVFISQTSANTTVTVDQFGTYTYTWTETNGTCVSSDVITVNYFDQPVANAGQGGVECDLDFILNASATVGVGSWTMTAGSGFANFIPNSNDPSAVVTVSQYGQYEFTWTEDNGICSSSDAVTVDFYLQPVANAGVVADQCDLDLTFAAVASAGSGTWTYTGPGNALFTPSINAATATVTVDLNGSYDFTWTEDNGGCTDANTVSVNFNALPVVSFTGLAANYCVDEAILVPLTGTPSGGVFSGSAVAGTNFIPFAAGVGSTTVTYTYTDVNGCSDSETQTVSVNGIPVASFTGLSAEYCADDATPIILVGTPTGGIFSGSGVSADEFVASAAGVGQHTITYEFTDPLGCAGISEQVVTVNPLPVVSFTGLAPSYCLDVALVTLIGQPTGGTFSGVGISGNTFSPINAGVGTHTIDYSYTDANGCTNSVSQDVVVNELPQPVITPAGPIALCEGSSITLDAGAGYALYEWNTGQNGQSLFVDQAGSYRVSVTSADGCQAISQTVVVSVSPLPVVDLGQDQTICTGSFLTLDAGNAGADFVWSNLEVTQQIIVGAAGSYEVTVTDANGCSSSDVVSVSVSSLLNPVITANGPTTFCQGETLTLNGGTGYSTYLWSNGQQSQLINVTTGGTFDLTVTDAFGCTGTATILTTVNQLPNAVIVPSGSTNLCQGSNVTLSVSNTFGSYEWLPTGAITPSILVSTAGTYTVTVTDPVNGCSATSAAVIVTQSQSVTPTIVANGPVEFCAGDNVVLSVEPLGAFTSYLWTSGSSSTQSITVTASGSYGVQVLDVNGCLNNTLVSNPVVVTVWNPQPQVVQNGANLEVINGPFATYQWFRNGNPIPGATTSIYTPTLSGNIEVLVSDENGCEATSSNIEFTVGIDDVQEAYGLNIYPNPNSGQFTIEADLGVHTEVTVIVKDMMGRELMSPERIEGASSFRRSFDISHLSKGVYYVQVIGKEGFTVRPVVKN
jgi:hypothetical protein